MNDDESVLSEVERIMNSADPYEGREQVLRDAARLLQDFEMSAMADGADLVLLARYLTGELGEGSK